MWSEGGQLWLKWKPPKRAVSEYVVEWVTGDQKDWQRETRSTTHTAIKGEFVTFSRGAEWLDVTQTEVRTGIQ